MVFAVLTQFFAVSTHDIKNIFIWIPRITDIASHNHPKKRSAYNASFKLVVVGYAERHGKRASTREFSAPETNIKDWRKQKVFLEGITKTKKAQQGRQGLYADMEKELYD